MNRPESAGVINVYFGRRNRAFHGLKSSISMSKVNVNNSGGFQPILLPFGLKSSGIRIFSKIYSPEHASRVEMAEK